MALRLVADVPPLTPDGDEARRWAVEELSDPAYRAAEPTGLDRLARDVAEWITERLGEIEPGSGLGQVAAIALVVVVVLVLVAAFLVWGRPRIVARSRAQSALFGADTVLSAAEHRRAAQEAAARGDWDAAIVERMRALARSLAERLIVEAPPGATVHAVVGDASRAFPQRADELAASARSFDDVRYLRRPGSADAYRTLESLDGALAREQPVRGEALV